MVFHNFVRTLQCICLRMNDKTSHKFSYKCLLDFTIFIYDTKATKRVGTP